MLTVAGAAVRVVWIDFGECFGVDICPGFSTPPIGGASLVEYSSLTQGGSVPLVARED